ncbi:MAG: polysaccharide deacetylase family protein, partial [Nanoarchaeota archaeon]|nr:polysaccharide deacetylase family protein [Nanoarchaeota archaeon]
MSLLKWSVISLFSVTLLLVILFFYASFNSSSDLFGDVISQVDVNNEKIVFLSFDDGPSYNTPMILKALNESNVSATFFLVGKNIKGNEEKVRDIYNQGHDIGTHSMTHPYLLANPYDEIYKSKKVIEDTINDTIIFFRPPFGFRTSQVIKTAEKLELKTIMWSSFPRDYLANNNKTSEKIIKDLKPGLIIVLHDHDKESYNTIRELP